MFLTLEIGERKINLNNKKYQSHLRLVKSNFIKNIITFFSQLHFINLSIMKFPSISSTFIHSKLFLHGKILYILIFPDKFLKFFK